MVNILCVGDVVGSIGCEFLRQRLPALKKLKAIDLCIVNGENSADGNGITHSSAAHLLDSGAADGRATARFGTQTHVPTADQCVLPKGTGYISDAGMTGVIDSVLGVKPEIIINRYVTKMPARFELAKGPCRMDCVIFTADEATGLCTGVERLSLT